MGIGREVELKQSSGQRDGPQSVGRRLKYLTESQVDFGGKSCIACIPWSIYTLSYLCLPSPSLAPVLSLQLLRQTTCVGFTVYPRHQDRPKSGRGGGKTMKMMTSADGSAILTENKSKQIVGVQSRM